MILHDVTNNPKLVKVAATPIRAKRLFEGDHDIRNVVSVPQRLEDCVGKSGRRWEGGKGGREGREGTEKVEEGRGGGEEEGKRGGQHHIIHKSLPSCLHALR